MLQDYPAIPGFLQSKLRVSILEDGLYALDFLEGGGLSVWGSLKAACTLGSYKEHSVQPPEEKEETESSAIKVVNRVGAITRPHERVTPMFLYTIKLTYSTHTTSTQVRLDHTLSSLATVLLDVG